MLTDAERKERRRITQARYRLKQGVKVGGKLGRPPQNRIRKVEVLDDDITIVKEEDLYIPKPKIKLTKESKIEDLLEWCIETAEALRDSPNPVAWASALNSMLKIIENLQKQLPPPKPVVKPRPRMTIVIEE